MPKAEQSQETSTTSVVETWSMEENRALVQFILFYGPEDAWPSHSKTSKFWKEAALYVQQVGASQSVKRTGSYRCMKSFSCVKNYYYCYAAGACRLRVLSKYRKQFRTPQAAEHFYFGCKTAPDDSQANETSGECHTHSGVSDCDISSSQPMESTKTTCIDDLMDAVWQQEGSKQLKIISNLFCSYALSQGVTVPSDFLKLFLDASLHLRRCNRINVVYGLAKAVGTLREDGKDSLLPAKRMPMGLVEHMVNFFTADNLNKVF